LKSTDVNNYDLKSATKSSAGAARRTAIGLSG